MAVCYCCGRIEAISGPHRGHIVAILRPYIVAVYSCRVAIVDLPVSRDCFSGILSMQNIYNFLPAAGKTKLRF